MAECTETTLCSQRTCQGHRLPPFRTYVWPSRNWQQLWGTPRISVDIWRTAWILTTLYSGHANIWSFESGSIVKSFELTDVPVRAGRFVARKNWIVCGSDDFQLRVLNYNTSEKVANFEAHPDYIRSIAVHPTLPYVLTASDDMTIKLWDFDQSWKCIRTFEGHAQCV